MQSKLIFYGGAGSVTGSNFMLDIGEAKFLIDCGFEQGSRDKEETNYEPFAYEPADASHLFVSHAHLDHVGRIPFLVKSGFTGKIISTHPTRDLSEIIMRDAYSLMEHAHDEFGAREPLYSEQDIDAALKLWHVRGLHEPMELPGGLHHEFYDAGHILGSAMSKFSRGGKSLVVTGDLGGGNSPLLPRTEALPKPQYLVIESVYGDRTREDGDRKQQLQKVITDTMSRGGTLLIPAFSTERTQDLLFEIRSLMQEKHIPSVPVFLDSPMAEAVTRTFEEHAAYFAPDIRERVRSGEHVFKFPELTVAEDTKESRHIDSHKGPKIILAGSGMSSGGRVLSHERFVLPDPNSTLLIVGYQAAGTIGRRILEGEKHIRIGKENVAVRAHVEKLFGYSAHRDHEGLMELVEGAQDSLTHVFVVEGEPAAANFLTQRINDYLGLKATAPSQGESATIEL